MHSKREKTLRCYHAEFLSNLSTLLLPLVGFPTSSPVSYHHGRFERQVGGRLVVARASILILTVQNQMWWMREEVIASAVLRDIS